MNAVIDRIEGNILVIEYDGMMYNVKKDITEDDVKEGDLVDIEFEDGKIVSLRKNVEKTEERKKYIEELTRDMWE